MKLNSFLILAPILLLANCGPTQPATPPMSQVSKPMHLEMKRYDRGDMGLAVGARRIEGTDFIVQPKGQASLVPTMILGPLAAFGQDALMEKKLDNEASLLASLKRIDLVKMCSDSARAKSFGKGLISDKSGGDPLRVETHCEFIQESKGSWTVGIVTTFEILNPAGKHVWGCVVVRKSPGPQSLADGWFKNDAAPLKSYLKSAFDESWTGVNGRLQAGLRH